MMPNSQEQNGTASNASNNDNNQGARDAAAQEESKKSNLTEFIKAALDHLLNFSTDQNELVKEIESLKEACATVVPDDHDYYHVRMALVAPNTIFTGLDRYIYTFSINDVIGFVIDLIEKRLQDAATHAGLELANHINLTALRNNFVNINHVQNNLQFASTPIEIEPGYMPWEILEEQNERYKAEIYYDATQVVLEIWLPLLKNPNYLMQIAFKNKPVFATADVQEIAYLEDRYLLRLIPEAKEFIAREVSLATINDLWANGIINAEERDLAERHWRGLFKIIANPYYYNLITTRQARLNFFILPPKVAMRLTHPTTLTMLNASLCTYMQASHLNQKYLELCTRYLSYILNQQLLVETILLMPKERSKFLARPIISNAIINKKRLALENALNLPLQLNHLLETKFFSDYFTRLDQRNKLNWDAIAQLYPFHYDFLQSDFGHELIKNDLITLDDLQCFSFESLNILQEEKIKYLILKKIVSIQEFKHTYLNTVNIINTYPCVFEWLCQKLINFKDIDHQNLLNIAATALARRLFAIYQHNPHQINGVPDTAKSLRSYAYNLAVNHQMLFIDLSTLTFNKLFDIIQTQLLSPDNDISPQEKAAFRYIFNNFIPNGNETMTWGVAYENLLALTDLQIQSLVVKGNFKPDANVAGSWANFFNQETAKNANALQTFFDNVLTVADFLTEARVAHTCLRASSP